MSSASFARAEAAWLEPPEPVDIPCVCGHSGEEHWRLYGNGLATDTCDECDCTGYQEVDPEQARWDAESEAGDAARKERGFND